ncbi:M20/M25/M40 family metallo-hydrolase [Shewanella waksmanii]|uniref:M20/M25/M40 family metallo-hydrolase n=1 Tax=Shewanella waksmanii TaxID=213783 RepID=UPI003736078A
MIAHSTRVVAKYALPLAVALSFYCSNGVAKTEPQQPDTLLWITIGNDAAVQAETAGATLAPAMQAQNIESSPVLIYQVEQAQLPYLTQLMHEQKHRCGGYIVHDSYQEAVLALQGPQEMLAFNAPPIQHMDKVNQLLPQIQAPQIKSTIESLTQFTNRFYNTSSGRDAANWLASHWGQLAQQHSWASVRSYNHSGWGQDSVILTLAGSQRSDEILVLGGHLDSTAGSHTSEGTRAPGADDDASGIASLTNVAKVLLSNGQQPQRSIHFIGYAAEEVGLRGSKEIAAEYKAQGKNVVAALQLDMTNYHGSVEDIVFMTDYVDSGFTRYMKQLLDTYQPSIVYGDDRCGYACSDHASWYNQGYPASMPFEARFNGANPNIHTRNDTLANSDAEANNSIAFAKLALSFAYEMANPTPDETPVEPVAVIDANCSGLSCQFDASASRGDLVSTAWSFGDGHLSQQERVNHTYTAEGQYQLVLTVSDAQGLTDSVSQLLTVTRDDNGSPCSGIANWDANVNYALGDRVTYKGKAYEAIWWSTGAAPDIYQQVWSIVADCNDDDSPNAPIARFSYQVNELSVSFTDLSTDDNGIVSHAWQFGDSQTSSAANPTHIYSASGKYSVVLTVTDSDGLSHSQTQIVTLAASQPGECLSPAWQASTVYLAGDKVSYADNEYTARWWTQGEVPSESGQWGVWQLNGPCQ